MPDSRSRGIAPEGKGRHKSLQKSLCDTLAHTLHREKHAYVCYLRPSEWISCSMNMEGTQSEAPTHECDPGDIAEGESQGRGHTALCWGDTDRVGRGTPNPQCGECWGPRHSPPACFLFPVPPPPLSGSLCPPRRSQGTQDRPGGPRRLGWMRLSRSRLCRCAVRTAAAFWGSWVHGHAAQLCCRELTEQCTELFPGRPAEDKTEGCSARPRPSCV